MSTMAVLRSKACWIPPGIVKKFHSECYISNKLLYHFLNGKSHLHDTGQHTLRSFTSRSGKSYRKGRRQPLKVKTTEPLPNGDTTSSKITESTAHRTTISTNASTSTQSVIHSTFKNYNMIAWLQQWRDNMNRSNEPLWRVMLLGIVPKRYRLPSDKCSQMYTYGQGILIAQRLAIWTVLVLIMVVYDETSPFEIVGIRGPSMIPTMAPDGSDLWLCRIYPSWLRQYYDVVSNSLVLWCIQPRLRHGSIVGFAHPDNPNTSIAMKRIVGLPGDRVQRYGQYVHLYTDQDPNGWGISWPVTSNPNHVWIKTRGTTWDVAKADDQSATNAKAEVLRTIVVPEGHVWIEADCPAVGLDSRHFGPIPISWIRTRVIAKVWPLQTSPMFKWYHRPHPIPLDAETLREYNIFHDTASEKLSATE